jgi:predicted HTH domain antitoxin
MISETMREKLTGDEIAAVEAAEKEHGDKKIAVILTGEGIVIVKRPARIVVKAFLDAGKVSLEEMEKIARLSLVYPSKEAFARILEEQPAAVTIIANEALVLAGAGAQALSGK